MLICEDAETVEPSSETNGTNTNETAYTECAGRPRGCPADACVEGAAEAPSVVAPLDYGAAITLSWGSYRSRQKAIGGTRSARVRTLIYAALACGADGSVYPGPEIKGDDGNVTGHKAPAGAVRTFAPLVPVVETDADGNPVRDDDGNVTVCTNDGRWIFRRNTEGARMAVPLTVARKIVSRCKIGKAVKYPGSKAMRSNYGVFDALIADHTIGEVIPVEALGKLICDIGVRLSPDKMGALLMPRDGDVVDEWARSVHGDSITECLDERDYEDAIVTVAVGSRSLGEKREKRARKHAGQRLASGAGTADAPVLRAVLDVPIV